MSGFQRGLQVGGHIGILKGEEKKQMEARKLKLTGIATPRGGHGWKPTLELTVLPSGELEVTVNDNGCIEQSFVASPDQRQEILSFLSGLAEAD
jgi:hypothetical protein